MICAFLLFYLLHIYYMLSKIVATADVMVYNLIMRKMFAEKLRTFFLYSSDRSC